METVGYTPENGSEEAIVVQNYSDAVEAKSSLFTVFCSGFALISDGLQNNLMSLTNVVFGQLYGKAFTPAYSTQISNALTIGTIIGQISIGVICDRTGRKAGIVLSTVLIVAGIILVCAAHSTGNGTGSSLIGFFWFLTIARGLTGVGVGGEYSASSASAAEAANDRSVKSRGFTFIMVTNLMLSLGGPLANCLYLIVFQAAGALNSDLSTVWVSVFALSIIPPLSVFYFRYNMINSKLYRKSAIQKRVPYLLTLKYYWKPFFGCSMAWWLYDFVVFPNGVFSGVIIASIVKTQGHELIRQTAQYQLLLGAIGLPGIFIGALLAQPLGRRNTMMIGFTGYIIFGLSVGLAYEKVSVSIPLFIFLFGMMTSFGNLGPGNMLGLTSSESFATPVRGTLYGLCAAIGKFGAVVGNQSFLPIRTQLGNKFTFIIAAGVGVLGVLVTYFFVRNDLNGDLKLEDERFAAYLAANGWTGDTGAESGAHFAEDDTATLKNAPSAEEKNEKSSEEKSVEASL